MLPNMFKLLFGGTPGLANRSALGDVKFLIGRSGLDFRLLSAMIYCVEFCGAFGTAIFFVAIFLAGVLLLSSPESSSLQTALPVSSSSQSFSLSTASSSCFPSCLLTKLSILTSRSSSHRIPLLLLLDSHNPPRRSFSGQKSRHRGVERLPSPRRSL